MKTITINEKQYNIKTDINDLTIREWIALMDILMEKEWDIKSVTSDKLGITKREKTIKTVESVEFKTQKIQKSLAILTDIPQSIFNEYDNLVSLIYTLINYNSFSSIDKQKIQKKIDIDGDIYTLIDFPSITFERFCYLLDYTDMDTLHHFTIMYQFKNYKWETQKKYLNDYILSFEELNAGVYANTFVHLKDIIAQVKQNYSFVFKPLDDEEEEKSTIDAPLTKMKEHLSAFKWHHILFKLSQEQTFSSTKGSLHGVKNANVFDVLDYLNWQFSYNEAENYDNKQKIINKNKNI